ncbi:Acetyltransferase (GNAT) family protein [Streptomyces sp. DconLS]|nr:Acetyltransferase (GNAT) family protein [Streptomyces sp. LamerLS-31b]SCG01798.1 Acetyltransferase (GNAT) family protein [Streptomyces sp. DconLS]
MGEAVGMARLVGDVTMYLLLVDVAVRPEHQGAGLGRRMVADLTGWVAAHGTRTTMLLADPTVVPFYKKLGFSMTDVCAMKYRPA